MPGDGLAAGSLDAERSPLAQSCCTSAGGGFTRIFLPFVGTGGVMALVVVGVRNPKSCQGLRRRSSKERSKQKELHGFCENKSACKDKGPP